MHSISPRGLIGLTAGLCFALPSLLAFVFLREGPRPQVVIKEVRILGSAVDSELDWQDHRAALSQSDRGAIRVEQAKLDALVAELGNAPDSLPPRNLSSFSVDVDTASYTINRGRLRQGLTPLHPRVEEFVNYFDYDYPAPEGDSPFAIVAELGPAPWSPAHKLVHIGLQAAASAEAPRPRSVVFVVDVSGSMDAPEALPRVKGALRVFAAGLREQDQVSLLSYADEVVELLAPTSGSQRGDFEAAVEPLSAEGGTNGETGLRMGFASARAGAVPGGATRVVLVTDGDFNQGAQSEAELRALIERQRHAGVFLSIWGVGDAMRGDSRLEVLADGGNGDYAYLDSRAAAQRVAGRALGGEMDVVAKDVKVQVEFNPKVVEHFELVGYRDRELTAAEFEGDTTDAGEMGRGQSVTALYQIKVRPNAGRRKLLTARVRYKHPLGSQSAEASFEMRAHGGTFDQTSDDFRFSAAVAAFALRLDSHPAVADFDLVAAESLAWGAEPRSRERLELIELLVTAAALGY